MSLRERLRLVFRRPDADVQPSDDRALRAAAATELEVVAYAEDCRLFGHLALSAARLTDMLNEADEIELVDVAVEALTDGRIVEMRSMVVRRHELLIVEVSGPRGARERRQRTRPHAVAVKSGPYIVRGHLHASPTVDPFAAFRRRPPMVPLTEGSITYTLGDAPVVRHAETVIVNRTVIDWVAPVADEHDEAPVLPPLPAAKGILLKDFTGEIHPQPHADDPEATPSIIVPEPASAPELAAQPAAPHEAALSRDTGAAGSPPPVPVRRPRKALKRAG